MVGGCWKRWSWWSSPACLYGRKEWRAAAELNRKSENFPSKLLLLWKKTFQSRRWAPKKKFLWWTERRSWVEVLLSLALLFHICFLKLGFRHSNLIFSSKLESRWYLQNLSKIVISPFNALNEDSTLLANWWFHYPTFGKLLPFGGGLHQFLESGFGRWRRRSWSFIDVEGSK